MVAGASSSVLVCELLLGLPACAQTFARHVTCFGHLALRLQVGYFSCSAGAGSIRVITSMEAGRFGLFSAACQCRRRLLRCCRVPRQHHFFEVSFLLAEAAILPPLMLLQQMTPAPGPARRSSWTIATHFATLSRPRRRPEPPQPACGVPSLACRVGAGSHRLHRFELRDRVAAIGAWPGRAVGFLSSRSGFCLDSRSFGFMLQVGQAS